MLFDIDAFLESMLVVGVLNLLLLWLLLLDVFLVQNSTCRWFIVKLFLLELVNCFTADLTPVIFGHLVACIIFPSHFQSSCPGQEIFVEFIDHERSYGP